MRTTCGADLHGAPRTTITAASVKGPLRRPSAALDSGSGVRKRNTLRFPPADPLNPPPENDTSARHVALLDPTRATVAPPPGQAPQPHRHCRYQELRSGGRPAPGTWKIAGGR